MPPTLLINSLEAVRRRAKRLSLAYGLGIILSAAAGLLLATVLCDYLLNLRAVPRLVLMAAAAGGAGRSCRRPFRMTSSALRG